jgi:hypothetical protein
MCVGFIWAKASRWDDAGSTCGASLKDMSAARVARQVLCQSLERKKAGTKVRSLIPKKIDAFYGTNGLNMATMGLILSAARLNSH